MPRKRIANKSWKEIRQEGWDKRVWIPDRSGKYRKIDSPHKGRFPCHLVQNNEIELTLFDLSTSFADLTRKVRKYF